MPELMDGAIVFAVLTALLVRRFFNASFAPRRFPVPGTILVGVLGAFLGPPAFAWAAAAWQAAPGLPTLTAGAVFIGVWVGAAVFFIANKKGQPRRVPAWAAIVIAGVATLAVPPLIDRATGTFQTASLRADVNQCTEGMTGQVQPREAINTCDFEITVGLCLPGEENPDPCAQSFTIQPGARAAFDPGAARLSSVPGNPGGLTVVACRTPDRPSRWGNVTGRGYRGVCLPPG